MLQAILLPFLALTPTQDTFGPWTETPGNQEFTGRLTIRPLQVDDLVSSGHSLNQATGLHDAAGSIIDPSWIREYVEETDEYIINIPDGWNENTLSAELEATGLFQYAEPDWYVYVDGTVPNDTNYNRQWHHQTMNSEGGWDYGTGDGVFIASTVDTGVYTGHPDLAGSMVSGYNSADRQSQANGGDVSDVHGHGTMTIGCVGAIGNNNRGVVGMAWDMKLMPVRCTNSSSGGAYMSDITDGARWASDNGARAVGCSWSGVNSNTVQSTGAHLRSEDSILVWAAGNSGQKINGYDHADVVVTAATNSSDNRTSWSNYGNIVDVGVPGDNIWTTNRSGGYGGVSGTSFSCPLAVGVLGMMMQTAPAKSSSEIEQMMYQNCKDLGSSGEDIYYGAGRPEFDLCMEAAFNAGGGGSGTDAITLAGPNGIFAGLPATFAVSRAPANSTVYLLYSTGLGGATIGGWTIDIGPSWGIATTAMSDASGNAGIVATAPVGARGMTVYLEAGVNNSGTYSDSNAIMVDIF